MNWMYENIMKKADVCWTTSGHDEWWNFMEAVMHLGLVEDFTTSLESDGSAYVSIMVDGDWVTYDSRG